MRNLTTLVLAASIMYMLALPARASEPDTTVDQVVTVYVTVDCDKEIKKLQKKIKRLEKIFKRFGKDLKDEVLK